jgi:hypothetical protein
MRIAQIAFGNFQQPQTLSEKYFNFPFMDFKELQRKVIKNALEYGERHNVKIDEEFALIKLFEEVGGNLRKQF